MARIRLLPDEELDDLTRTTVQAMEAKGLDTSTTRGLANSQELFNKYFQFYGPARQGHSLSEELIEMVRLRIALGDVRDSFEFILTERERSSHVIQLGRGFLQDVALVDVGRQFIQPRLTGKNDKEGGSGR